MPQEPTASNARKTGYKDDSRRNRAINRHEGPQQPLTFAISVYKQIWASVRKYLVKVKANVPCDLLRTVSSLYAAAHEPFW